MTVLYWMINTEQDYTALQHDVNSWCMVYGVWSLHNHLSLNPAKYKSMVLSRKKIQTTPPVLNLLDSEIEGLILSSISA